MNPTFVPILHSGPGIVIGIPTLGRPVPIDWAMALKSLNPPTNFNCVFQLVRGQEIGAARQAIAEYAVSIKAKYLFFLGDDVVVPAHTLKQLIYRLEQDATISVVGGVYCAKTNPSDPLVYRGNGQGSYWDWKVGEFFEVTGLGLDCNLIRVSVFDTLPKPWFKTVDTDKFLDGINDAEQWTEDLYFYKKVSEANGRIFCDSSVLCEHHDVYGQKIYRLPQDSLPMRVRAITKTKKCLLIGPKVEILEEDFDIVYAGQEDFVDYRVQAASLPFESKEFDWVIATIDNVNQFQWIQEWVRVTKTKLSLRWHKSFSSSYILGYLERLSLKPELKDDWIEILVG
jgi:hypothetical protein